MNNTTTPRSTTTMTAIDHSTYLLTYTEAKAHALANYETTDGLVIGGTYIIRGADGTTAEVEFRVVDGAVALVGGQVVAWQPLG